MKQVVNIYCDESCHLENDGKTVMTLGGVWCPKDKRYEILNRIKDIKQKHGFDNNYEIKWSKIITTKIDFYLDIVDYFFDTSDLHFRCLIVRDKTKLNHDQYNQDHNEWYYKMYFEMLTVIIDPKRKYNIYIDIKDTKGGEKVKKLKEVLCNSKYDFDRKIVEDIQIVRSHEIGILQITDLFVGAISYLHRNLGSSETKKRIIERIIERSKYPLTKTTLLKEDKFNLFIWDASTI